MTRRLFFIGVFFFFGFKPYAQIVQSEYIANPKGVKWTTLQKAEDKQYQLIVHGEKSELRVIYDSNLSILSQANVELNRKAIETRPIALNRVGNTIEVIQTLKKTVLIIKRLKNEVAVIDTLLVVPRSFGDHAILHYRQNTGGLLVWYKKVQSIKKKSDATVEVIEFNSDFTRKISRTLVFPKVHHRLLEVEQLEVSDSKIYVLGLAYTISPIKMRAYKPNSAYFVYQFNKSNVMEKAIKLSNQKMYISSVFIEFTAKALYFGYGFSHRMPNLQDSFCFGFIDLAFGAVSKYKRVATEALYPIKNRFSYNWAKEGYQNIFIDAIIPTPNGLVYILENYKGTGNIKDGYAYYYGDVILYKLDWNAQKVWMNRVSKSQYSNNDRGRYSSYSTHLTDSSLTLFYLTGQKQKPFWAKLFLKTIYQKASLNLSTIHLMYGDNVSKSAVIPSWKGTTYANRIVQFDSKSILFPVEYKKFSYLIKLNRVDFK